MTTLEMMYTAERTNSTYISEDLHYTCKHGFTDENKTPWKSSAFDTINQIMEIDDWEKVVARDMTLEEIEDLLGYRINLIGECDVCKGGIN